MALERDSLAVDPGIARKLLAQLTDMFPRDKARVDSYFPKRSKGKKGGKKDDTPTPAPVAA